MPDFSNFDLGGSPELGQERVAAIADKIGRRWGRSSALPLNVAPSARVHRLPFGIMQLDWMTWGGLVIGRINRMWGPKSTLKSTLCLRALRMAQNYCRHCKSPLVRHPECTCLMQRNLRDSGFDMDDAPCPVKAARDAGDSEARCVDCRCPKPRFWLADDNDYAWLSARDALRLCIGQLPENITMDRVDHPTLGKIVLPVIEMDPPAHLDQMYKDELARRKAAGIKTKPKKPGKRKIVFTPSHRCEPWRCLYLDSEQTIDAAWARANGVDTRNVLLVGAGWAEKSLTTIEDAVIEQEFDLIIIDSESMLETAANQEKALDQRPVVAAHANLMGRFVKRHISVCAEEGLTARYRPTVLCTSQAKVKGIGNRGGHAYLGPTGGNTLDHGISLEMRMKAVGYSYDKTNTFAVMGAYEFEVTKNKAGGSPGVTGTIKFYLREHDGQEVGDSDDLDTVMRYSRQLGTGYILEGGGARKLTLFSDFIEGGQKAFQRVGDCALFLRTNPTIFADLRARVLRVLWDRGAPIEVGSNG